MVPFFFRKSIMVNAIALLSHDVRAYWPFLITYNVRSARLFEWVVRKRFICLLLGS